MIHRTQDSSRFPSQWRRHRPRFSLNIDVSHVFHHHFLRSAYPSSSPTQTHLTVESHTLSLPPPLPLPPRTYLSSHIVFSRRFLFASLSALCALSFSYLLNSTLRRFSWAPFVYFPALICFRSPYTTFFVSLRLYTPILFQSSPLVFPDTHDPQTSSSSHLKIVTACTLSSTPPRPATSRRLYPPSVARQHPGYVVACHHPRHSYLVPASFLAVALSASIALIRLPLPDRLLTLPLPFLSVFFVLPFLFLFPPHGLSSPCLSPSPPTSTTTTTTTTTSPSPSPVRHPPFLSIPNTFAVTVVATLIFVKHIH
ncbi:hypothetical protein R3P38DRAFT_3561887 [Favolaschia claudopus]|uniref:Uncharacterized protein n=1 Tax=Favolaschia claudopus TaxID=2862362 RepID=A0AAW0AU56_9AGAR